MLHSIRSLGIKTLIVISLTLSTNSFAATICTLDCPSTGGGTTGSTLPQILEIFSTDDSSLLLDTTGLIILDSNIYNNSTNLTIDQTTSIFLGQSALPSTLALPDVLELSIISYSGGLSITGLDNDYVLLRQFSNNSSLNLSAINGILIMDTSSLTAVPLPGSIILMLSGLTLLVTRMTRRNKI